ncbi:hypothetical protein [Microbulbifer sp. SSSA005]
MSEPCVATSMDSDSHLPVVEVVLETFDIPYQQDLQLRKGK